MKLFLFYRPSPTLQESSSFLPSLPPQKMFSLSPLLSRLVCIVSVRLGSPRGAEEKAISIYVGSILQYYYLLLYTTTTTCWLHNSKKVSLHLSITIYYVRILYCYEREVAYPSVI